MTARPPRRSIPWQTIVGGFLLALSLPAWIFAGWTWGHDVLRLGPDVEAFWAGRLLLLYTVPVALALSLAGIVLLVPAGATMRRAPVPGALLLAPLVFLLFKWSSVDAAARLATERNGYAPLDVSALGLLGPALLPAAIGIGLLFARRYDRRRLLLSVACGLVAWVVSGPLVWEIGADLSRRLRSEQVGDATAMLIVLVLDAPLLVLAGASLWLASRARRPRRSSEPPGHDPSGLQGATAIPLDRA